MPEPTKLTPPRPDSPDPMLEPWSPEALERRGPRYLDELPDDEAERRVKPKPRQHPGGYITT